MVQAILGARARLPVREVVEIFAPANIALCKYWGKRPGALNLPVTSSLSLSLGNRGSRIRLRVAEGPVDDVCLDGDRLDGDSAFVRRTRAYFDLLCGPRRPAFAIEACNTVPTAAGFASSASGFAALVQAVDAIMGWGLQPAELSVLARMGSGSACRSLWHGFVHWHRGEREDGMDSFAEPIPTRWPELRLGMVVVDAGPKAIGSTEGMRHTQQTSPLYAVWPEQVARDIVDLRVAIEARDFPALGAVAEGNAMAMHATMLAARPALCYWTPGSVEVLGRVWQARRDGLELFATMDAGPNVKVLLLEQDCAAALERIPGMQIIDPWQYAGISENP